MTLEDKVAAAKETRLAVKESQAIVLPDAMDWRAWSLPVTASILSRIPLPATAGESLYLTPEQAAIWAIVSYEQKLSPFTGDTWFNPRNNRVNLTLQGKLTRARQLGMNLGAPKFIRIPEDPKQVVLGYRCELPTKNGTVSYTAMYAEWAMPSNPNWQSRKEHMLQIRAYEKAVSFAAGVGVSEQPGDLDLTETDDVPEVTVTPVEFVPMEEKKNE